MADDARRVADEQREQEASAAAAEARLTQTAETWRLAVVSAVADFVAAATEAGLVPTERETVNRGLLKRRRRFWRVAVPTTEWGAEPGFHHATLGVLRDGRIMQVQERGALGLNHKAVGLVPWVPPTANSMSLLATEDDIRRSVTGQLASLLRRA